MSNVRYLKQQDTRSKAVRALEMLLDYATIEGAELRLPVFVRLIDLAKQELIASAEGDRRHIENTP